MQMLTQDPLAQAQRMTALAQIPAVHQDQSPALAMREKIDRLYTAMAAMPQCGDLETGHYFVPGMYCRTMHLKAGTTLVGKKHKVPHFFLFTAGEAQVVREDGTETMRAGEVLACAPGAQRVFIALSDVTIAGVYLTDKTDIEEIEKDVTEHDERATFDAYNRVIAGQLEDN